MGHERQIDGMNKGHDVYYTAIGNIVIGGHINIDNIGRSDFRTLPDGPSFWAQNCRYDANKLYG